MRVLLTLIGLCGVLSLYGCTSRDVWFATTRMEITDYRGQKVAVLPVSVLPGVEVSDEVKKGLQDALVKGLSAFSVRIRNVEVVGQPALEANGVSTRFPWTPERVAAAASVLSFGGDIASPAAAAIGISITAAEGEGEQSGYISVLLVFADAKQAEQRRWAMSGTWLDSDFEDIVDNIKNELGSYFIDLKWLARAEHPFKRDTYEPDQPFMTVSGALTSPTVATTAEKGVRLRVTGIHDAGIEHVEISNTEADFSVKLDARDGEHSKGPIYYSTHVTVPVAFGPNTIHISAQSSNGKSAQWRPIRIQRTSPPSARILAIGVSEYEDLDPVRYSVSAAHHVVDGLSREMAGPSERRSTVVVTDDDATQNNAIDEVGDLWSDAGPDDRLVFYFAGRLAVVPGRIHSRNPEPRLYLAMSDASSRTPGIGALSLNDLSDILRFRNSIALLDLCADEPTGELDELLSQSVPPNAVAYISSCGTDVGRLGSEAVAWSRTMQSQTPDVLALASWLKDHVPRAVAGTRENLTTPR